MAEKKKIAIVTGASGGLGKEFVHMLNDEDISEIWCIGRNQGKLEQLKKECGEKIVILPLDLNDSASLIQIQNLLAEQQPTVRFLINNAGVGEKLCAYNEFSLEQVSTLISVNCTSVVSLCILCIPFMQSGGKIINIASQSSFQPVPYLNLYASSKAFVRNYTRALNVELKGTGVTATAVCPGWVDTGMIAQEVNGVTVKYPGMASARSVVQKALRDAKKNKDMSVYSSYVKYMHFLAKIFPQKSVMKSWMFSIKKYL